MATGTGSPRGVRDIEGIVGSSQIGELSEDTCRQLLSTTILGRVAWTSPDGPQVLPVNFRWDNGQLIFRTSPYGVLAQLVRRQRVAFEVDDVDTASRTAWSVVVRGEAGGLTQSPRLLELWRRDVVETWAAGSRPIFVAIDPVTITGRYIRGWA